MRIRTALSHGLTLAPGVVDAGLASLAGFLTAVYAAHYLQPAELGAYALYFSGFLLAGLIPLQVYFVPIQVASLGFPLRERVATARPTALTGSLFCAAAALVAPLPGLLALSDVDASVILALAVSNAVLVFFSPLQDHVRVMHHYCEHPSGAVAMSALQLATVVVSIGVMHAADVPPGWIPFGSLALANVCSTALGLLTLDVEPGTLIPQLPPLRTVVRLGGVLLIAEVLLAAAALGSDALVLLLVSAEALGFAAAAGAVARPVVVFSIGLSRFIGPRVIEAGMSGVGRTAKRLGVMYAGALVAFLVPYLLVFGWSHPLNPMEQLIPTAFSVSGLVVTLSIGLTAHRWAQLPQWFLLGARRSKALVYIALVTSLARLAGVAALAPLIDAHAAAAGQLIEGSVRGAAGWRASQELFSEKKF